MAITKPSKIPKRLQSVLWSTDVNLLNLKKHQGYIIHQILLYGTFSDIRWLFDTYSKKEIITTFLTRPSKNYPREVFNFVKNYILSLKNKKIVEDKYVTSVSHPVRPRTAGNF